MSGFFRVFGLSAVSAIAVVAVCNADTAVAPGRAAYQNVRPMAGANAVPRMPSMPTITIPGTVTDVTIKNPQPQTPQPEPEPEPEPEPTPTPDCPDGGVKNSDYTVENCMDDLKACITGGALSGGMTELYDKNVRDDIFANMGLCRIQVEKCIADVRVNCEYVYETSADVWYDFNLRRVQPEYFDFVLRKTGLTPYQAENTCRLLDKNTYGTEFAAVDGAVTDEYDNKIGAYNEQQNNSLKKDNPVGALVNENGVVDAERGHYARWDAKTATCYIRVAAYNKDKHISNTWLFGTAGDDQPAEVWQPAGSSFKCNKDLFGFSLMNDTRTVATVAVPGGAIVGAGVGAGIGAGTGAEAVDCSDSKSREKYFNKLKKGGYLPTVKEWFNCGDNEFTELTKENCETLLGLNAQLLKCFGAVDPCDIQEATFNTSYSVEGDVGAVGYILQCIKGTDNTYMNTCVALRSVFCRVPMRSGGGNVGLGAGVGAAVGAGAGGIATAITALVEHNNVNCRVGDGLSVVPLGKSHEIGTLRDIYVKWGLRLPETVVPTLDVRNCQTWRNACASLADANQCRAAIVSYRSPDSVAPINVKSACMVGDNGACQMNYAAARAHGACKATPLPVNPK